MHRPTARPSFVLILFAWIAGSASLARAQDLVGLYVTWTQDPTTTATINWVDLYPKNTNTVFYRERGTDAWQSGDAKQLEVKPSALQRRYLELTGLKPDTSYEFGIGKRPEKPAEQWSFRTMPAELTRPVRFVSGGDMMHSRQMLDAMSDEVGKLDPDFAIFGGDLAYENGVAASRVVEFLLSWRQHGMTKDRRLIPVVACIGNHEVRGGYNGKIPDDAPYFYGLFTLPGDRAYYALDFGKYLSLIVLDSAHTNPIAGAQAEWLGEALAERAGQRFLFPVYHYPAYGTTKGPPGKLPIDTPRAIELREHWTPLFDRFGVSAVFENDHHNFKRTHPLRGHKRDGANGIVYLGDGAWGVATRDVPDPAVAWWLAKAEPRNHVWVTDLKTDGSFNARAIDPNGETFDEATFPAARTRPVE